MKIRLAKKIMKQWWYLTYDLTPYKYFDKCNFYWVTRLICYPNTQTKVESLSWKRDHRITKAINLTSKKSVKE